MLLVSSCEHTRDNEEQVVLTMVVVKARLHQVILLDFAFET